MVASAQPEQTEQTNLRLAGRVAIITGGGHGIGRAYAQRFAEEGAAVVVAELDADAAAGTAAALRQRSLRALGVATDVADPASVAAMVEQTLTEFGRIDIVINNAAIFASIPLSRGPFEEINPADWEAVLRVNLTGVWQVCRQVAPQMRTQGYGKIINISSDTAFKPVSGMAHYVASKAGVVGLSQVLAQELGPSGIRVNCIAPTSVLSEEDPDEALIAAKTERASRQAIKGLLRPEDLVGTALYLAGPESDFVTGQTIMVNGGAAYK